MNCTSRLVFTAITVMALGGSISAALAVGPGGSTNIVRGWQNGHAYLNGGINQEQATEMLQRIKPYDLRLTFQQGKDNSDAAGVDLRIVDTEGSEVFSLTGAGPLTGVDLPPGNYRIIAGLDGVKQRTDFVAVKPGKPVHLRLHWPKGEGEAEGGLRG